MIISANSVAIHDSLTYTGTTGRVLIGSLPQNPPNDSGTLYFECGISTTLTCDELIIYKNGRLEIKATQPGTVIQIKANRIVIEDGGVLQVGSPSGRPLGKVIFTLTNNNASSSTQRTLEVQPGGTLDLYGEVRAAASWTQLGASTIPESISVNVQILAQMNWRPGDQIVVAATDFMHVTNGTGWSDTFVDQTEVFTLTAVNGNVLVVDQGIQYEHYGASGPGPVDYRAEVGLLTRSIVVQGETSGPNAKPGQLVFLQEAGKPTNIHLDWVEFTNLGDAILTPGGFPLHFHQMGDVAPTNCFVTHCSIHDNVRDGLVIHKTDGLLVDDNVFYNTAGWHLWFQDDDGFSKNHKIRNNLAILARQDRNQQIDPLETAAFPNGTELGDAACFYIRSFTDNEFVNNHAASSECCGFYVDTREPWGEFEWDRRIPHEFKTGKFKDNVAHSCAVHGFYLGGATEFKPGVPKRGSNPPPYVSDAFFDHFTTYKNNGLGFHCRNAGTCIWYNVAAADNGAGMYLASQGRWEREMQAVAQLDGGIMIGETTDNLGVPAYPWHRSLPTKRYNSLFPRIMSELTGVSMYDGILFIDGVHFVGFNPAKQPFSRPNAGAFGPAAFDNPWAVDPRNRATGTTFDTPQLPAKNSEIYFRPYTPFSDHFPSGIYNTILNDDSGGILGGPGVAFLTPNQVFANAPGTHVPEAKWGGTTRITTGTTQKHPFGQLVVYQKSLTGDERAHTGYWKAGLQYLGGSNQALEDAANLHIPAILIYKANNEFDFDFDNYMCAWNLIMAPPSVPPAGVHKVLYYPVPTSAPLTPTGAVTVLLTGNEAGSSVDVVLDYTTSTPSLLEVWLATSFDDAFSKAGTATKLTMAANLQALLASTQSAYYFDGSHLYFRAVLPAATDATAWGTLGGAKCSGAPQYFRVF